MTLPLLVFTDLDGTLLDHETYGFDPARPALAALKKIGAGVILASSKTAAEMEPLRLRLGLSAWPAIVENGAGILPPGSEGDADDSARQQVLSALAELPEALRATFRGFSDMTAAEVSKATGLGLDAARRAKLRLHSEPGLFDGSDKTRAAFMAALGDRGISARSGGRFLTLSLGRTKADCMARILTDHPAALTVALGDAPNDAEMLKAADRGFIVANPHGTPLPRLPGEASGRIRRTSEPGPTGWNAAILGLLADLKLNGAYPSHG